jgi:hypothetical protein
MGQLYLSYDVLIVRTRNMLQGQKKGEEGNKEAIVLSLLCGAAICRKAATKMMCMMCLNVQPTGPNFPFMLRTIHGKVLL